MGEDRYHRNTLLPGWDQARLTRSTVIVMGMGALGNAAAQSLALAGVGRLILCDMDLIERTNLSRAPLFQESDVGRLKVDAATDGLSRLTPDVRVEARAGRLEHAVGLAELRDADLVLGCLDSRAARLELAGRCGLVAAPWIDGATGQWDGEIRPYLDPPEGPCYGCGLTDEARSSADVPLSCRVHTDDGPAGAAAPLSMIVGVEMALPAVRWMMGLPVSRDILLLDGHSGEVSSVQQRRDAGCPYHHTIPAATKIGLSHQSTAGQLCQLIGEDAHPLVWKPFQVAVRCRRCGFQEERVDIITSGNCPRCGNPLKSRTQLEIRQAPAGTTLRTLGIAPGEILPVKAGNQIDYIELETEQEAETCRAAPVN